MRGRASRPQRRGNETDGSHLRDTQEGIGVDGLGFHSGCSREFDHGVHHYDEHYRKGHTLESPKSHQQFTDGSMTGAAAARIAHRLIEMEYRGHGDLDGAMYRLQSKTGISYWCWRNWWGRAPSESVLPSTWERLVSWYNIECSRQMHLYKKELQEAKALIDATPNRQITSLARPESCRED